MIDKITARHVAGPKGQHLAVAADHRVRVAIGAGHGVVHRPEAVGDRRLLRETLAESQELVLRHVAVRRVVSGWRFCGSRRPDLRVDGWRSAHKSKDPND